MHLVWRADSKNPGSGVNALWEDGSAKTVGQFREAILDSLIVHPTL